MQITPFLLCVLACLLTVQAVQPTYILKKIGQGVKGAFKEITGVAKAANPTESESSLKPKSIIRNTNGSGNSGCGAHIVNIYVGKDVASSEKGIKAMEKVEPQLVALEPVPTNVPTKTEEIPVSIPVPQVMALGPPQ